MRDPRQRQRHRGLGLPVHQLEARRCLGQRQGRLGGREGALPRAPDLALAPFPGRDADPLGLHGRRPRRGDAGGQRGDQAPQALAEEGGEVGEDGVRDHHLADMLRVVAVVRQVAGAHRVQDEPGAPHVGRLLALLPHEALRGQELHRVPSRRLAAAGRLPQDLARAEVGQHGPGQRLLRPRPGLLVHMQHDVRGLEVAVEDAAAMQVSQAAANVQEEMPDGLLTKPRGIDGVVCCATHEASGPDHGLQRAGVAVLHEDEEEGHIRTDLRVPTDLQPRVLVVDDVHVPKSLQRFHFPHHLPQPLGVVAQR
mmetsp:Transcript_15711/g.44865  ORF Transcript_15711/g.44865 Transcript_15711/m.44865 type:complete len:310 (+) Transcript_15711:157-1086(+)